MGNLKEPFLESSRLMVQDFDRLMRLVDEFEPLTGRFNRDIYRGEGNLAKVIATFPYKNLTGRFGVVTVNCFSCAGATNITLHAKYDEDAAISFVGPDDGTRDANLHAFYGRKSDIVGLIDPVAKSLKKRQWEKDFSMRYGALYLDGMVPVGYE